jgi:hypothetical protein
MSLCEVESIVGEAERKGDLIGVRRSVTDDDQAEDQGKVTSVSGWSFP